MTLVLCHLQKFVSLFVPLQGNMDGNRVDHLRVHDTVEGAVDHRGRPAERLASGQWRSAVFIIGVEVAERSANSGVGSNLINYLSGPLHEPTAAAAAAVNAWSGTSAVLPLLGALLADSYLGRYRTIIAASVLYCLGLGMLTLSALLPTLFPPECTDGGGTATTKLQVGIFYFSLYLVAFAQAGHRPCVQAFGADQFDDNHPDERKAKSSFFNWWYFSLCGGGAAVTICLNYVQDNISWSAGYAVACILMALALLIFLIGTGTYRYYPLLSDMNHPLSEIPQASAAMSQECSTRAAVSHREEASQPLLVKAPSLAALSGSSSSAQISVGGKEGKGLLRLFPIWASCLTFAVVLAQSSTFFTKQASTMDRRIGSRLQVPPASLQCCIGISTAAFVLVYDRAIVPAARELTGRPSGITMLQRIGTGLALSASMMLVAALVEKKRLETAVEMGLVDLPDAVIPMSIWWLLPQYVLSGVANVFTMVGLQEFFYDQVPDALRSLGLALYLSIFGIGDFISGFIVSVIDSVTRRQGQSWFSDNLNRAHLHYFYFLLAGIGAVGQVIFLHYAQLYAYKQKGNVHAQYI